MITLNGVTLNDSLIWTDEYDNQTVSQNIQRTVLGNLVVQNMPISKGNIITLQAQSSGDNIIGSFTRTQVEAFKALEQAGTVVEFVYDSYVTNVIVQAGGVKVSSIFARSGRSSSDIFTGVLTLITV